jgi:hypothetical protein
MQSSVSNDFFRQSHVLRPLVIEHLETQFGTNLSAFRADDGCVVVKRTQAQETEYTVPLAIAIFDFEYVYSN